MRFLPCSCYELNFFCSLVWDHLPIDMTAYAGICFILAQLVQVAVSTNSPMNVLFLVSDDMRPELGVFNGPDAPSHIHPSMHTPNLDGLSKQSLLLKQAFVQQAICGPSRASLLTGRRPDTTHVYDLNHYWRYNPRFYDLNHRWRCDVLCVWLYWTYNVSSLDVKELSILEMLEVTSQRYLNTLNRMATRLWAWARSFIQAVLQVCTVIVLTKGLYIIDVYNYNYRYM